MGHLGNPIGFRLSFHKNWQNNWFIKNLYYPEFINDMINIRDYLYYYMTRSVMLKSGFCLSHFFLYKFQKNYYIKIYIYQIDLEKLSYDYINKAFFNYYEVYNQTINKPRNRNNKMLVNYFRDLSNSDLYVFYFTFFNFIYKRFRFNKVNYKSLFLKDNIYLNNYLILDYSYMVLLDYINIILLNFKDRFLLTQVGTPNIYDKVLRQKNKKRKQKFNKLFLSAFKILIKFKILLKKKIKKGKLFTDDEVLILEACLKKILKRKKKNIFYIFFKNLRKHLKFLSKFKMRDTSCDPYFIYKINRLEKRHYVELQTKIYNRKSNIKFVDFFFIWQKK